MDSYDEQRRRASEVAATYHLLEEALPLVRHALMHTVPTINEQQYWWGAVTDHEQNTGWRNDGESFSDLLEELEHNIRRMAQEADDEMIGLSYEPEADETQIPVSPVR